MEALVEWMKAVFGKRWVLILPVVAVVLYGLNWYNNVQQYHTWAGSYAAQTHDINKTQYKDGKIRVFWNSYAKPAHSSFTINWILYSPGTEPQSIHSTYHPYDLASPYAESWATDETNLKIVNAYGRWVEVGDLKPGTYTIRLHYVYDAWWLPEWYGDQQIIFEVK